VAVGSGLEGVGAATLSDMFAVLDTVGGVLMEVDGDAGFMVVYLE
jgi:hypothetical protein